jgi:hypothetical protein
MFFFLTWKMVAKVLTTTMSVGPDSNN